MNPEHGAGVPRPGRRTALRWLAGLAVAIGPVTTTAQEKRPEIVTAPPRGRRELMARAFELRQLATDRGDEPYGAVVARDGRIVGEGISGVVTDIDPTAHAEVVAIRAAARALGTRDLSGCELYGSSRACPMCEAAAFWARISRMHHGAEITDAGPPRLR